MIVSPRRAPRGGALIIVMAVASLFAAIAGACTASPDPVGVAPQPGDVPPPRGAVLDVGATGPGLDGDIPFFGYTSDLAPREAMSAYTKDLVDSGYRPLPASDGWVRFGRGSTILQVRVGASGPPTSIVVQVVAAATVGAAADPTASVVEPSNGTLGSPEPPRGSFAIGTSTPTAPVDPGPGKGNNGQGKGAGSGNGAGNSNATPKPKPTKKPKPNVTATASPTAPASPTAVPDTKPGKGKGVGNGAGNGKGPGKP